ncbi:DUF1488 domain-containing protein [Paraburkholderia sediminicola]|nr:DUF1488 domain-containing protein [Paraburkholderia sediminicola]
MEALELEPSVSTDGVVFALSVGGRDVACVVTRETLEQHFWLQPGATDARVLKAFSEGRRRITAFAERKARVRPGERIVLTVADFDPRK